MLIDGESGDFFTILNSFVEVTVGNGLLKPKDSSFSAFSEYLCLVRVESTNIFIVKISHKKRASYKKKGLFTVFHDFEFIC